MHCPFCNSSLTRVIDSRLAREGRAIRRRRNCETCGGRFTTYETVEQTQPDVVKRDGTHQPFDRDKILKSIRLACKKRPVNLDGLMSFIDRLELELSSSVRRTVSTEAIGERILRFLRDLDPVAYFRYASVYRSFGSVDEFLEELNSMQGVKLSREESS